MRLKLLSVVLFAFLMGACSVPKDVVYFQGIDTLTPEQKQSMNQTYTTKIVPDDMLNIAVTASDPTVATPFNPPAFAYAQQGEQPFSASQSLYTYLVDKEGHINFPVIGKVQVTGLTKQELSEKLQNEISQYITNPLVNVQITNFRVTMMGEVSRPGALVIRNDRLSILDAIGQVGDLTINANRKNVLIIRDNNGVKEFARIDMTSPDLLASPFFYLKQNDVVYVEPNKVKQKNSRYSQSKQYNVSLFSSIISAVSVITSMVITIVNLKNKN